MSMIVRLAESKDRGQIRKYDHHIDKERLDDCIRAGQVFVLCDGADIYGVLRWSLFWQSVPFLDLVYLDEGYRGQGWGRKMMAHWEAQMTAGEYPYVLLSTQADENAQYFYDKLGYRRIGAFLPPEQEADELVFAKTLERGRPE